MEDVSRQMMVRLPAGRVDVVSGLPVPIGVVPSRHSYVGLGPPLYGMACSVTGLPAHTLDTEELIVTESVTGALTVTVIALDVAVAGDTQVPDGVMTQVMLCVPAVNVLTVNEGPVPIVVAPSFH